MAFLPAVCFLVFAVCLAQMVASAAPPSVKKPPPPHKVPLQSPPKPPPSTGLPQAKRISNFIAYCRTKGFTKYADYATSSGFNETLRSTLVTGFDLTLFVPTNAAFNRPLTSSKAIIKQILLFHSFYPPLRFKADLDKLSPGAKLLSVDQKLNAYKLKTNGSRFNGRPTDVKGAAVLSTFYTDLGSTAAKTRTFVAHSVDFLMNPSKIF